MPFKTRALDFTLSRVEHETSGEDHVRLEFEKSGGRGVGSVDVLVSVFMDDRNLTRALENAGYKLPIAKDEIAPILKSLREALPDVAGKLCASTGWKKVGDGEVFLLPSGVVSHGNDETGLELAKDIGALSMANGVSGSTEDWGKVARAAAVSNYAAMAILASLAAPLYKFSALEEGCIINFAGNGSSGKSTCNRAAASIWGNPDDLSSWNASGRAIFEVAAANSDMPLVLDDTERGDGKAKDRLDQLEGMIHTLTAGRSKSYARIVSGNDQLPPLKFKCIVLSSSPTSVEDYNRAKGTQRTDGDRARLLEIRVPHGDLGGIWWGADLTSLKAPRSTQFLSEYLSKQSKLHYGQAGKDWVQFLVDHHAELPAMIERHSKTLIGKLGPDLKSVEGRIAGKIALLYAAGRIARKAKIIRWNKDRILAVSRLMFQEVVNTAFQVAPSEQEAFDRLRSAITDKTRFPVLEGDEKPTNGILPREGFVRSKENRLMITNTAFTECLSSPTFTDEEARSLVATIHNRIDGAKVRLHGHGKGRLRDVRIEGKNHGYLVFDYKALLALIETIAGRSKKRGPEKE